MNIPDQVVFVVDDDAHIRNAFGRLLRSNGYCVETYEDAGSFMRRAELKRAPACLLLDVRLPDSNGIEVQRQLDGIVPIVFLSAHDEFDIAVTAMKEGAMDFLVKPVDESILFETTERALDCGRRLFEQRERRKEIERRVATLTPREREVMELVVTGRRNKVIGYELGAAEKTIKQHRARVMEKMGANSLAMLVQLCSQYEAIAL
ncbi:response regulator transcription factor [Paraburkholderia tropica]|uniref:response regulator transcription factor n=1 Tax=Paraburkholderia tropica TaxID=92647 RepID=UPI003F56BCD4